LSLGCLDASLISFLSSGLLRTTSTWCYVASAGKL
jgi:hypothetical protein